MRQNTADTDTAAGDDGAGTVLVLLAVALVWLGATWFVTLSGAAGTRSRAGAAADLAALAAAAQVPQGEAVACAAAGRVARANRAAVRVCELDDASGSVMVVVAVAGSGLLAHAPPAIGRARAGPDAGTDVGGAQ